MSYLLQGFSITAKPFFFEIFSHARLYVRVDDDENKKIYFLYIFLFFTLFTLLCSDNFLSQCDTFAIIFCRNAIHKSVKH